jgi:hypothetical protein
MKKLCWINLVESVTMMELTAVLSQLQAQICVLNI